MRTVGSPPQPTPPALPAVPNPPTLPQFVSAYRAQFQDRPWFEQDFSEMTPAHQQEYRVYIRGLHEARDNADAFRAWGSGRTVRDGVHRWDSNGRCVPRHLMERWARLGWVSAAEVVATRTQEEVDNEAFMRQYAADQAAFLRTPEGQEARREQVAEMRAAFGEGAEVVDVISGLRTQL